MVGSALEAIGTAAVSAGCSDTQATTATQQRSKVAEKENKKEGSGLVGGGPVPLFGSLARLSNGARTEASIE